jgi:hypothetical protein
MLSIVHFRKKTYHSVNHINPRLFLHVIFLKRLIFTILFLLVCLITRAQDDDAPKRRGSRIIDDTTKQIYGPTTSRYFFEQDIFYNREDYHVIDTLIRNFHRWNFVQGNNNFYQDLGNIGTAIRPIFYQTPAVIGVSSGFSNYDLYWNSERIKYYDTKSPYSNMKVILGGKGRSITHVTYSRNINPRWNFGFNYRALLIDKQIQRKGKGDRITRENYYDFYTTYQSKDSAYRVFFNFQRMFHKVNEFGGVNVTDPANPNFDEFYSVNAKPSLLFAATNDMRINTHLFQQYKFGSALQAYHIFDRYRQRNEFFDLTGKEATGFFDYTEISDDTAQNVTKFKTVRNEVGIKGNLLKLFYNGYVAVRHYSMTYNHLMTDTLNVRTTGDETYLGGRMAFKLDSLVEINGWAEVMQTGNYRIQGDIKSKWFEASLKQIQYAPTFATQGYRGSHDVWKNNFSNSESTQINGYLHYRSSAVSFSPGLTFTRLRNYVFYRQQIDGEKEKHVPFQSTGNQIIFSPEFKFSFTFLRHVSFDNQVIYTKLLENADAAIRLPEMFINSQLSYSNIFYHGNLDMHAGVDVHWKSAYKALGYDPAIQQFYTQDTFTVPAFPLVDLFFNAKVKRGRIFIKWNNIVQMITKNGYLPTPYYPGQRNVIDFGFDWSFYD